MWDVDGNEYIDYVNNYGPLILGHRDLNVTKAVKEQLGKLWLGAPTEIEIRLAEKVTKLVSSEAILFCPTGSEACMKAIRTYRALTGRDKVAMFDGAYHGSADSLFFSKGIPRDLLDKIIQVPFNDAVAVEKSVRQHKEELAAFIVEPTLGQMGHEPARPEFYKAMRDITRDNDVPLIFDEIVTGFRIAAGGAQERFGVKADMVILGKILGGGFPLAAFASSKETMSVYAPQKSSTLDVAPPELAHPGTFNDFKVSMAAGLSTLEQLTPHKYEHLELIGANIRDALKRICSDLRIRAEVTGIASIFHLHFTDHPIWNADSARRANRLLYRYFELGMLNKGVNLGKAHSSFCSSPMTREDIKHTLVAAKETLIEMKPVVRETAPALLAD
jgi:glutamate-1-semialdehyde 2,1-aminomutase